MSREEDLDDSVLDDELVGFGCTNRDVAAQGERHAFQFRSVVAEMRGLANLLQAELAGDSPNLVRVLGLAQQIKAAAIGQWGLQNGEMPLR